MSILSLDWKNMKIMRWISSGRERSVLGVGYYNNACLLRISWFLISHFLEVCRVRGVEDPRRVKEGIHTSVTARVSCVKVFFSWLALCLLLQNEEELIALIMYGVNRAPDVGQNSSDECCMCGEVWHEGHEGWILCDTDGCENTVCVKCVNYFIVPCALGLVIQLQHQLELRLLLQ